jgi:O-antigen/teichoic acid export membrane protein
VPLAVRALGTSEYGFYAVVLSTATFFAYADFGLGLAAVNTIAVAENRSNFDEARTTISDIWFFLIIVAATILTLGTGIILGIHWAGVSTSLVSWANVQTWLVFLICVTVGLPSGLTQRVLYALDRNYQANLWQTAGKLSTVVGAVVAYSWHLGLIGFIIATLGLPVLVGWVSTAWLYFSSRPDLAPTIRRFSLRAVALNIPSGFRYMLLQFAAFAELGFDIILVASILGTRQAASYDLITRVFNYIPALAALGIMPLWPAIAGAFSRNEHGWIRKTESISFLAVLGLTLLPSTVLAFFAPFVVHVWTGATVHFSLFVTLALATVAVASSVGSLKANIIMAKDGEKRIFNIQSVLLIILIAAKVLFLKMFGIIGIILVTAILYIPRLFLFERILREYNPPQVGGRCKNGSGAVVTNFVATITVAPEKE